MCDPHSAWMAASSPTCHTSLGPASLFRCPASPPGRGCPTLTPPLRHACWFRKSKSRGCCPPPAARSPLPAAWLLRGSDPRAPGKPARWGPPLCGCTYLAVVGACVPEPPAQAADAVQHQAPDQVVLHGPVGRSVGRVGTGECRLPREGPRLVGPRPEVLSQAGSSGWWGKSAGQPPRYSASAPDARDAPKEGLYWPLTCISPWPLPGRGRRWGGGTAGARTLPATFPGLTWLSRGR